MSLRLPQSLFTARTDPFDAGLQTELLAEQAASLGRAGTRVETTLAALAMADDAARPAALKTAADAVWALFIQRELMGQRNQKPLIEHYGIPKEVLVRLGAR